MDLNYCQYLSDRDRERGAWTNEDPNWRSGSYDILEVGTGVSGRSEAPTGQVSTGGASSAEG